MKIFLSWSGPYSNAIARALKDWLPQAYLTAEPFMSSEMRAGSRWQSEVAAELEAARFGIVCVTADNQDSPWLNFEAGALSKAVEASYVVPLAIDLRVTDIKNPIGQFQAQPLSEEGIERIVLAIDGLSERPKGENWVRRSVHKW